MPDDPTTTGTWMFDAALFVGVFSALTWGFLVLFKPRTYRPDPPSEE